MHNSILLSFWAGISFVIYKIVSSIITSRRHAAAARRLGCVDPPPMKQSIFDPLGIKGVIEVLKADKEHRLLQYFKKRSDLNCDEQGNPINTLTQHLLGTKTVFTTDPRNVQAILATQFKDFGLGRVRNATFAPLLGHGIVSHMSNVFDRR